MILETSYCLPVLSYDIRDDIGMYFEYQVLV